MKNLSILKKILIIFIAVGLISIVVEGLILSNILKTNVNENAHKIFSENIKFKKRKIQEYFEISEKKIKAMSEFFTVKDLFGILTKYHEKIGANKSSDFPVKSDEYMKLTDKYSEYFLNYTKTNNYYDLFFICEKHGHVMFSVAKEEDLGTNLSFGKYKDSHLANVWRRVIEEKKTVITDYKFYEISGDQASFVGTPVYENNELIGVLVLQISKKILNNIVNETNSIYKTSETYIIGKDKNEKFSLKTNRIIKKGKIGDEKKGEFIEKCITNRAQGNGVKIGSTGLKEYIYYSPLEIEGLKWGIFNTINVDEVTEPINSAEKTIIIITIIAILIIIISAYLLAKSISDPIKNVVNSMKKMSKKDLDIEIYEERKDEIGELYQSINEVNKNFKEIISNINRISISVSSASKQLSVVSQEVSERASEQASSTEEISSSMEEMLATINSNTENAFKTNNISKNTAKETKESGKIFKETMQSVSDISKGILIIKEIAFQIDLLSLNASVEAARAGSLGKSFGVVAYEIRKLAEKTKKASAKIEELSDLGQKNSEITSEKLKKLIPEIIKSAELVDNITLSSKEQSSGAETINNSVQQLTEITNENSASAEEMSASAEELLAQVKQLRNTVRGFKIGEDFNEKNEIKNYEEDNRNTKKEELSENGFRIKLDDKKLDDEYESF